MLNDIQLDIRGSYYDPKYHGVDLDARFKEAKGHIKTANTYNQAIASIAWAIRALDDSHTYLVPPRTNYNMKYGYGFMMVGEDCFVAAVQPGSDAEKKGLKVGDRILSLNRIVPARDNLWEITYLFRMLRPQLADELVLRGLDGTQRTLVILPKVAPRTHHLSAGISYWDTVRDIESHQHFRQRRSHVVGNSILIWSFPSFLVDDKAIDEMMGESRKFNAVILDLRGNGGGYGNALLRLIGNVSDHDITVATPVARKPVPPLIAKTRGDKTYAGKLIVLVDSKSASASELFARTMQLQSRATVLGDGTAGSVMEALFHFHKLSHESREGYGAMITEANLVMPDGKSLEHAGVVPDERILPTAADLANHRDPALSHAVQLAGGELSPEDAGKLFPIEWPKE